MRASRKKSSFPTRRTRQNPFIRTNHSRRIHLVGNNSNELVAQGAAHARPRRAPVQCAGPEAFSLFALFSGRLQAALIRLTNPFVVTPLECALTQKHRGVGALREHSLRCHHERRCCAWWGGEREGSAVRLPRCIHGRNIVASDNSGNAEKRKQIPRAYAALGMTTTR